MSGAAPGGDLPAHTTLVDAIDNIGQAHGPRLARVTGTGGHLTAWD